MNSDFKDLLQIFAEEKVEYLVVGAYAVIHYTQPRYTKDIEEINRVKEDPCT